MHPADVEKQFYLEVQFEPKIGYITQELQVYNLESEKSCRFNCFEKSPESIIKTIQNLKNSDKDIIGLIVWSCCLYGRCGKFAERRISIPSSKQWCTWLLPQNRRVFAGQLGVESIIMSAGIKEGKVYFVDLEPKGNRVPPSMIHDRINCNATAMFVLRHLKKIYK